MSYNQGLLIGRAFALANGEPTAGGSADPVAELCHLADGDRMAIVLAQARYREFVLGPSPTVEDRGALTLLEAALDHFDTAPTSAGPVAHAHVCE